MSRRENFEKTIAHAIPDNIILDLGGNPLSSMEGGCMDKMLQFLGFNPEKEIRQPLFGELRRIDERILKVLDIDTRSVGHILKPEKSQFKITSEDEYIDEWGIPYRHDGIYWNVVTPPLKGATISDLDGYKWPDADSLNITELQGIKREAQRLYEDSEYVVCAEHPVYGIFELGCWLCGFDDFLLRLIIDKEFVIKLFDIILNYQLKIIDIYYGLIGDYIHYTSSGDDFATQTNLFMSPDVFRELIKPYYKKRISKTKEMTKSFYLHHSCGSVYKIIEDLIDVGVEILNPIQPEALEMNPANLKNSFGGRIVLHGGIGTQQAVFSDKETLDSTIKETIDCLNSDGGYIFAAAHNLQEDVPPEAIIQIFEAGRKYGKKKNLKARL